MTASRAFTFTGDHASWDRLAQTLRRLPHDVNPSVSGQISQLIDRVEFAYNSDTPDMQQMAAAAAEIVDIVNAYPIDERYVSRKPA